jgi:cyclophilin family peptidyl-prolyl cis-trans isomerase
MKRFLLSCLVILLAQVAFAQDTTTPEATAAADAQTPTAICASAVPATDPASRDFAQPDEVVQPGVDYRAIFCTDVGPVYVDLLENYAPLAVNSFVFLAQQSYYNNTTFHRVIQDFMAQGGDPTATGTGGPGYQFNDEYAGFLNFDKPGWLAMANSGANTNGSQFFITTAPYPSLNFHYTIFGEVLEGQNNVVNISIRDPEAATTPGTKLNTVVIVTDPSTVKTTYEAPAPATRDDISTLLDTVNGGLPASLTLDKEHTGIFETAQVAQSAPEALQSDYAAFLAKYHHEFRVSHRITNGACDMTAVPYMAISYTLDRFDTPEDAAAALKDGFLQTMETSSGLTETAFPGLEFPAYTQPQKACDTDATNAVTFWQRGHFVVTAQALFPANSQATADRWLRDLVGISYESIFSDVLRPEMR